MTTRRYTALATLATILALALGSADLRLDAGLGDDDTGWQLKAPDAEGRVEVRTEYDSDRTRRYNSIDVSVDFTVMVPAGATVDRAGREPPRAQSR